MNSAFNAIHYVVVLFIHAITTSLQWQTYIYDHLIIYSLKAMIMINDFIYWLGFIDQRKVQVVAKYLQYSTPTAVRAFGFMMFIFVIIFQFKSEDYAKRRAVRKNQKIRDNGRIRQVMRYKGDNDYQTPVDVPRFSSVQEAEDAEAFFDYDKLVGWEQKNAKDTYGALFVEMNTVNIVVKALEAYMIISAIYFYLFGNNLMAQYWSQISQ